MEPTSHKDVKWDDFPHFVNADGKHIFCRYWRPAGNPKALVFINHGAGEHSRWYAPIAELLTPHGYLVCAHDHIGHGLSEGDRVHVNNIQDYIRDLMQHVELMQKKYKGLPVFLIGHSMGGTIVLKAGLDHPKTFTAIVLIAPAIVPNPETATYWKVMAARLLAWVMPQLQVGKIEKEWISRDNTIRELYEEDPLNYHGGLKARWSVSMLDILAQCQARLPEIQWPFLLLHGTQDKLCEISGSQLMYEKAASKEKKLEIFEGGYHQCHNEPDGEGVRCKEMIVKFINDQFLKL